MGSNVGLRRFILGLVLISVLLHFSCETKMVLSKNETSQLLKDPSYFHEALDKLTDVIVHDIFSPPVASRVYAYPCIAAHQVLQRDVDHLIDLSGKLNDLKVFTPQMDTTHVSFELAAMSAFFKVSKTLIFSEEQLENHISKFYHELDSLGVSELLIKDSKRYGEAVANHILEWADQDNYKESRSFSKFTITENPTEWKPTPPAYMEGIEPHWKTIRPMLLDSAQQFVPSPPTKFDLDKDSKFFKETMQVYTAVKESNEEQKLIASFWDCNPYVMNQTGHMMFATKKITPGGHWMGIASIASETAGQNFVESIQTTTYVSLALFDGFISCWDEKYRSSLIRPETVINENIDEAWIPLLQTPPFPEHTSGHSVISTAAATILTSFFGSPFNYLDDVEVKYGLPSRKFESFIQASDEAAISRLYGGIHYMPAITEGVKQGKKVGDFIVEKLNIKRH